MVKVANALFFLLPSAASDFVIFSQFLANLGKLNRSKILVAGQSSIRQFLRSSSPHRLAVLKYFEDTYAMDCSDLLSTTAQMSLTDKALEIEAFLRASMYSTDNGSLMVYGVEDEAQSADVKGLRTL